MLTIIIGFVVATAVYLLVHVWVASAVWCALIAVLGFIATTVPLNLWVKKRLEALFNQVQRHVEDTQGQLRRKINMMQTKMVAGGKGLQKRMEKEQAAGIREALKQLDGIKPLHKWNFLAARQANTLRAQLHYQIKEFEAADECFKNCLVMDPLTLAMKMARQYKRGEIEELERSFRKGVKRFKDEKGVMLYALYSWVLVKEHRIDDAVEILNEAKDKTENEVLSSNWEHLVNGRERRFSNAGIGDEWYALHLESPKPIKMKQRFGGRRR